MKKWLDDLYAILMKRGFNTLDNVLKKYRTQIEDYEEIKINDEIIILEPNETISFNFSSITTSLNIYDRFCIYNRGDTNLRNFLWCGYKYSDYNAIRYSLSATSGLEITGDNSTIIIKNVLDTVINLNIFIKKIC